MSKENEKKTAGWTPCKLKKERIKKMKKKVMNKFYHHLEVKI